MWLHLHLMGKLKFKAQPKLNYKYFIGSSKGLRRRKSIRPALILLTIFLARSSKHLSCLIGLATTTTILRSILGGKKTVYSKTICSGSFQWLEKQLSCLDKWMTKEEKSLSVALAISGGAHLPLVRGPALNKAGQVKLLDTRPLN